VILKFLLVIRKKIMLMMKMKSSKMMRKTKMYLIKIKKTLQKIATKKNKNQII